MAWSQIFGHDDWIESFRAVKQRGRLAHAYLFVGPEGIGKRLFARELAKAILCENPPAEPPLTVCGSCPSCHLVDADTHPDLFQIAKPEDKNEMPVDSLRALSEKFGLRSARGRGQVAIVDDADHFNEEAANCFLKTLEEPPPGSAFFLIATSLDGQLPTIRSRCQAVRFAPLPKELVKQFLEKDELPDPALLPRLLHLAEGSPGQARLLGDPDLWRFRSRLLSALAKPRFDSVAMSKAFVEFAEAAGKEAPLQRARARLTLKLVLAAIRDAVRAGLGEPAPAFLADEAQLLQALAARAEPEKWLAVVDRCLEAEVQIDRYIQLGLVLEGLLDALGHVLDRA
jgi:DNA polymerase-3 subunit delta'